MEAFQATELEDPATHVPSKFVEDQATSMLIDNFFNLLTRCYKPH